MGKRTLTLFMFNNRAVLLKPMTVAEVDKYKVEKQSKVSNNSQKSQDILSNKEFEEKSEKKMIDAQALQLPVMQNVEITYGFNH